ncbi:zinc-ribbon domain-containing protein [Candidatus Bathyarchaeota archaeon]|nr:zinc-ribbon domain-containing protein [Candidatus Bathyarchaeota archaeon]
MQTSKKILSTTLISVLVLLAIFAFLQNAYAFPETSYWSSPKEIGIGYYPSLTALNKKIWVAYTTSKQDLDIANEVRVISSNDNGTTWSAPRVIFEAKTQGVAWSAHHTTFLSSSNELWLAWNVNRNPGGETTPAIYFANSNDSGSNWYPMKIPHEGNMPHIINVQNKIWLFYDYMQGIAYTTSSDGGASWSEPFTVTPTSSKRGFPMACQVNGEIWVVYSDWNMGWELNLVKSMDGITWSSPQKISNATSEQRKALIEYYNDTAFVFFPSSHEQSWSVYVTTSSDGITWSTPLEIVSEFDSDPLLEGFGEPTVIGDKLWFVFSSNGGIFYTTLEEQTDNVPVDDLPIWQQWWFWTNVALAISTGSFALTTLYYRNKSSNPKETKITRNERVSKEYRTCPNCGASLPIDSKFCGKCGTSLE